VHPLLRLGANASEGRFLRSHFAMSGGGPGFSGVLAFLEDDGSGTAPFVFLIEVLVGVDGEAVDASAVGGSESLKGR